MYGDWVGGRVGGWEGFYLSDDGGLVLEDGEEDFVGDHVELLVHQVDTVLLFWLGGWGGGWVGGWVGLECMRKSYWTRPFYCDGKEVGGWVGGWVTLAM